MRRAVLVVLAMLALVAGASAGWAGPKKPSKQAAWPFKPWDHAKAYTFNFFEARPGVPMRVLDKDGKWSPHIRSEQPLTREQAERVIHAVTTTKGSFESSKCPFPRHAFVYFDEQDRPVATVDICFECEDLFVSPDFEISDEAKYADKNIQRAFEKALMDFRWLFEKDLGQPADWKSSPQPTPVDAPPGRRR